MRSRALAALFLLLVPIGALAQTTKVFIDQDTSGPGGTDSISIAMLLKAPNIEVVGIGVVAGDAWLDQAIYHTLRIAEVCGKPGVPIAAGAALLSVIALTAVLRLRGPGFGA